MLLASQFLQDLSFTQCVEKHPVSVIEGIDLALFDRYGFIAGIGILRYTGNLAVARVIWQDLSKIR